MIMFCGATYRILRLDETPEKVFLCCMNDFIKLSKGLGRRFFERRIDAPKDTLPEEQS